MSVVVLKDWKPDQKVVDSASVDNNVGSEGEDVKDLSMSELKEVLNNAARNGEVPPQNTLEFVKLWTMVHDAESIGSGGDNDAESSIECSGPDIELDDDGATSEDLV